MNLTVVVRIKDLSYLNIVLYSLEKFVPRECPVFIVVPKKLEQYAPEIRKLTFINPSLVMEDDDEDVCGISRFVQTPLYLFFEEKHILKMFLRPFKDLPCCLETFPHGKTEWTTVRSQWFEAFQKLGFAIEQTIYERMCMTLSPQIFITDTARKLFQQFGKVNIPLYWFSLNQDLYKSNSTLWSKNLCENARHPEIPREYLISNIRNGFKNSSLFITIASSDLLQTVYENMPKPSYSSVKNMLDELVLFQAEIPFIRLGENRDGGYIICDIPAVFLYSFGVGNSYLFEQNFTYRYGCEKTFLYDHTVSLEISDQKLKLEKTGIDHFKHDNLDTLENLVKKNGHTGRTDLCLKIDVEGYEWLPLLFVPEEILCQFTQIVIELHWLDTDFCATIEQKTKVLKRINKFFYLVHVHGVNCQEPKIVNGMKVHPVIEATFVRKNFFKTEPKIVKNPKLPIDLDRPVDLCLREVSLSDYYPWNNF